MKIARTDNTIKGSIWGIVNRIVCTVVPFIIRTIVIYVFGMEYLGLNSLFTSILHVLNLSELGLSSAIVYNMYEPVAKDDYEKIGALLNLYRKLYLGVGTVILVLGIACLPFLPVLINQEYPEGINIYILYLIFLINTCISYFFFGYKESVLSAYQRNDIINIVKLVTFLGLYGCQILVLLVTKNFYIYAGSMIVFTLLKGVVVSVIVSRRYPQIRCTGSVGRQEKKSIREIMIGTAIGKLCAATRGTLDEILVSTFLGLVILAIFDNYYYIMYAIISILIVVEDQEKNHKDFEMINFFYMWLVGWFSACLVCMYQPFMSLWVGKGLLFGLGEVFLFGLYFFASGMSSIPNIYANANGLWWKMRYKSICEVVCNLILNLIFVQIWGVKGIIVATVLTLVFVTFLWGTVILYKNYFDQYRVGLFIGKQFAYLGVSSVSVLICYSLCNVANVRNDVAQMMINACICTLIPNTLFWIIYHKTENYQRAMLQAKKILFRKMRKKE